MSKINITREERLKQDLINVNRQILARKAIRGTINVDTNKRTIRNIKLKMKKDHEKIIAGTCYSRKSKMDLKTEFNIDEVDINAKDKFIKLSNIKQLIDTLEGHLLFMEIEKTAPTGIGGFFSAVMGQVMVQVMGDSNTVDDLSDVKDNNSRIILMINKFKSNITLLTFRSNYQFIGEFYDIFKKINNLFVMAIRHIESIETTELNQTKKWSIDNVRNLVESQEKLITRYNHLFLRFIKRNITLQGVNA